MFIRKLALLALPSVAFTPLPALSLSLRWPSSMSANVAPVERSTTIVEPSTIWVVEDIYKGESFFDQWDFYDLADPTYGQVTFVDRDFAFQNGLAGIVDGQAMMRVDNWTQLASGAPRNSVRISSQKTYNGGLFILDAARSPWGCSVWPAFWTLGADGEWPNSGEIDVTEGIHDNTKDQITWHTRPGCNLVSPGNFSGTALTTDCDAATGGCGIQAWSQSSYGPQFNELGGGVYAMKWDEESISVWFFYRAAIPPDIVAGNPQPSVEAWGVPAASLSSQGCDLPSYFFDHQIIFDITICGQWAGPAYPSSGCPGTCSSQVMDPQNYDNALWAINSLSVFRKTTLSALTSASEPQKTTVNTFVQLIAFTSLSAFALGYYLVL